MKTKLILASAVTAFALATPALAGTAAGSEDVRSKFDAADSNKDGNLSQAEWTAAKWSADKFKTADVNSDGKVDFDEKYEAHKKMSDDNHS